MSNLVRLFFGPEMSDSRGEVFFHLAYNGTQYDRAINAVNVNSLLAEPLLQLMLAKNWVGGAGAGVHDDFRTFVQDVANYHRTIDDKAVIGGNAVKLNLLDKVYKNPNVPLNVRKFFDTHLKVLNTDTGKPTDDYSNPAKLRFNLVKTSSAASDKQNILFASTIPLLPSNLGDAADNVRRQYTQTYGATIAVPARSNKTQFTLNIQELIKNCILARDTPIPASVTAAEPLEDLYESVVTGARYVRDKDGKLCVIGEDGKPDSSLDFEGAELTKALQMAAPNCASTGLDQCDDVYKCLLSGKPEVLSECLERLKDGDMFERARKEVAKMNPKVAVQLLRTFGFKPRRESGSNIVLPPTFEEWSGKLSRTVDAATAEAIKENKKLMKYLRAVVEIVRSNPAIINTNLKDGNVSDFARKTGLSVFRNPFPDRKVSSTVRDGVLFTPQVLAQSMQLPLALQLANVSGRVRMPFQMGGGSSECPTAKNIKDVFNVIYSEMEKNGKVLIDSDKARITATIDKLEKLEKQLMRLMDDAKLFTKLNAALNPGQSVSTDNVTLNDITNASNENITADTLGNLNDCITKNIRDQSQVSNDLMAKVYNPLLNLLIGGSSDALSPVM
jgi:hypothetical protein